jgi:hypothetical protein
MAVRWAIASGNFSSTATWNNGAILGIPTSADDVWANGFTVNMDVNATVISLNTTSRARTIATPQMTANNAPSPFVAAASGLADSRQPFQAFDRSYDTVNNYWSAGWPGPQWVSIDFGSGNATIIDGYTIFGNSDATINPNTWQLQGSNDNISWTPLHSVSGSTIPSSGTYSIASIGNLLAYRYYRINVTAIGSGTGTRVRITEIELYQPGTAALAAGGSFNFNTAGVTVSATRTSQGASNLFTVTNTTGTVDLSVATRMSGNSGQTTMTYSGAGNLSFACPNLSISNAGLSSQVINKTGSGTLTFNGNPILTGSPGGQTIRCILSSNGNVIINGNIFGSPVNSVNGTNRTVEVSGGILTINGNVIPTLVALASSSLANCPVFFSGSSMVLNGDITGDGNAIVSSGAVTVNGTLRGGNSVVTNNTITINMNGDVYAGLGPSINCSAFPTSIVNLTGNMYNNLGRNAIWCLNVFISNTATTLWRMDTGGGNYKFLYSADSTPNLPATTNVRNGVTFGPALSLTGTMVVLANSNVRKSVPNDNSVGTEELTSADIISGINASTDPTAVRIKTTLTDKTAGNIISQYNNS